MPDPSRPTFSFIVLCNSMSAQVVYMLKSLEADYQQVDPSCFEVLIGENPSADMLSESALRAFSSNVRYERNADIFPLSSAMNRLAEKARGDYLILIPDGARILSSGVVRYCMQAVSIHKKSIVAFHDFRLGRVPQQSSQQHGAHSEQKTAAFLSEAGFPGRPQALFRNASWSASSNDGVLCQMAESGCLMLPRSLWKTLNGFDERLDASNNRLAGVDFYNRALSEKGYKLFFVLGEGTFQQIHGEQATDLFHLPFSQYREQLKVKTGRDWKLPTQRHADFLGHVPPSYFRLLQESVPKAILAHRTQNPLPIQENIKTALSSPEVQDTREILFVLGMHRSMTSYVARKLIAATSGGVPGTVMPHSVSSNPEGHFEPHELVVLHNNFFNEMGLSWKSLSSLPDSMPASTQSDRIRKVLSWGLNTMRSEGISGPAIVKDPRLARFWPLWESALTGQQIRYRKIILIDHPEKVAQSLFRRDGMSLQWARLLWVRYTLDALRARSGRDIVLVVYQAEKERLESALSSFAGVTVCLDDYRPASAFPESGRLVELFNAFRQDGDTEKFTSELAREIEFIDRHHELFREIDGRFNE